MIRSAIILGIGAVFLAGGDVNVRSIKSCAIWEYHEINGKPEKSELLASQIPALNRWSADLDSDWTFELVDQPYRGIFLRLEDEQGRIRAVELRGNALRVGSSYKVLTGRDRAALTQILALEHRLPDFRES
jgi:hypothetical protein